MIGLETELQAIYDSEINVHLVSIWDAGWRLGVDAGNDVHWHEGTISNVSEILPALQSLIKAHFPNSMYAKSLMV